MSVPDAFADFVRQHYAPLVRSAYLLVGDIGHAEDVVQTALVVTMRKWPGLADPEAYTRTVLMRAAGRWRRRRWHGELPHEEVPETAAAADVTEVVDVHRALARLPWAQRAVLVLRYFDDLSEQETALVLGCRPGTVKSRASRALETLRRDGLLTSTEVPHG